MAKLDWTSWQQCSCTAWSLLYRPLWPGRWHHMSCVLPVCQWRQWQELHSHPPLVGTLSFSSACCVSGLKLTCVCAFLFIHLYTVPSRLHSMAAGVLQKGGGLSDALAAAGAGNSSSSGRQQQLAGDWQGRTTAYWKLSWSCCWLSSPLWSRWWCWQRAWCITCQVSSGLLLGCWTA